jgi:hypothetical protein
MQFRYDEVKPDLFREILASDLVSKACLELGITPEPKITWVLLNPYGSRETDLAVSNAPLGWAWLWHFHIRADLNVKETADTLFHETCHIEQYHGWPGYQDVTPDDPMWKIKEDAACGFSERMLEKYATRIKFYEEKEKDVDWKKLNAKAVRAVRAQGIEPSDSERFLNAVREEEFRIQQTERDQDSSSVQMRRDDGFDYDSLNPWWMR